LVKKVNECGVENNKDKEGIELLRVKNLDIDGEKLSIAGEIIPDAPPPHQSNEFRRLNATAKPDSGKYLNY